MNKKELERLFLSIFEVKTDKPSNDINWSKRWYGYYSTDTILHMLMYFPGHPEREQAEKGIIDVILNHDIEAKTIKLDDSNYELVFKLRFKEDLYDEVDSAILGFLGGDDED